MGSLTNFPDGITSFGVPVIGGGAGPFKPYATYYFVDANNFSNSASDGNEGLSPEAPFLTMGRAFDVLASKVGRGEGGSGSVICFIGNIREQLVTPEGVFDVTVIGGGNFPRNADAFNGNSGYSAATWKSPSSPTAETALCRVLQQGWSFQNFLWSAPSDWGALELVRNAASDTDERDASWCSVLGCRFAGGLNHIRIGATSFAENLFGLQVKGCTFNDSTGASIFGAAGGAFRAQIVGNVFDANITHIDVPFTQAYIAENDIGLFTTAGIDLTGGANNVVTKNALTGTYANSSYVAGTSDFWVGNFATAGTGVSDGVTTTVPA